MYDPARLKGVLVATSVVAMALLGFSALSIAMAGGRPSWLAKGDSTIEGGQEKLIGGRIAGVAVQARSRPGEDLADLGVIFGASAVGMGIDPRTLEREADSKIPAHWLSLYANGANVADLHDLSAMLFQGGIRPKLLVLGIHPGLLARSDDYLSDRTSIDFTSFRRELAAKHALMAKDELGALSVIPLNWAFPNRTRISNLVRGLASSAKRRMFASLKMGVEALYPADPNPWGVRLLVEDAEEPAREAAAEGRKATVRDQAEGPMREGLAGPVKDKGWNNADAYSLEGANALALVSIIREARAGGIEVAVLLLPEASNLRNSVPQEAMNSLRVALDRAFGAAALPPVIDLRDALADSQFHDSIHPRKVGREITTRRLIDALRARKAVAASPR
jgi:hypothetical protein